MLKVSLKNNFENIDFVPFLAAGITIILGAVFLLTAGATSGPLAPASKLEGRTWITPHDSAQDVTPMSSAPMPAITKVEDLTPKRNSSSAKEMRRKRKHEKMAGRAQLASAAKLAAAIKLSEQPANSINALDAVIASGTYDTSRRFTFQDIMDRYEADESKYPLNKAISADGVTLSLEGLEKRESFFVLKVSVDNETATDFFVKDFDVRVGAASLESQPLFRVLVEPQRIREGFIIFEKPGTGASAHIILEEDGGKRRVLDAPIAYRF